MGWFSETFDMVFTFQYDMEVINQASTAGGYKETFHCDSRWGGSIKHVFGK